MTKPIVPETAPATSPPPLPTETSAADAAVEKTIAEVKAKDKAARELAAGQAAVNKERENIILEAREARGSAAKLKDAIIAIEAAASELEYAAVTAGYAVSTDPAKASKLIEKARVRFTEAAKKFPKFK
jgi:hypothetical protein